MDGSPEEDIKKPDIPPGIELEKRSEGENGAEIDPAVVIDEATRLVDDFVVQGVAAAEKIAAVYDTDIDSDTREELVGLEVEAARALSGLESEVKEGGEKEWIKDLILEFEHFAILSPNGNADDIESKLTDEEKPIFRACLEKILRALEDHPYEIIGFLKDVRDQRFRKELLVSCVDAISSTDPKVALDILKEKLKELSFSDSEIVTETERMKDRVNHKKTMVIVDRIKQLKESGELIEAARLYSEGCDGIDDEFGGKFYLKDSWYASSIPNELLSSLKAKMEEIVASGGREEGIKFYRLIPDLGKEVMEKISGVIIYDILTRELTRELTGKSTIERLKILKDLLKDDPDILIYNLDSLNRLYNSYEKTESSPKLFTSKELIYLVRQIKEKGNRESALGCLTVDNFDDEDLIEIKDDLFKVYRKNELYRQLAKYLMRYPEDFKLLNRNEQNFSLAALEDSVIDLFEKFNLDDEQIAFVFECRVLHGGAAKFISKVGREKILKIITDAREKGNTDFLDKILVATKILELLLTPEALEKLKQGTSRFKDALGGGESDRISPIIRRLFSRSENFSLSLRGVEEFIAFLDEIGPESTPKLYDFYINILRLKKGEIKELPEEQQQSGLDTVEKIRSRFKEMKDKIISGNLPEPEKMEDIDYDILAVQSMFYTSHWARSGKDLKSMHKEFEDDRKEGRVRPLPAEYAPTQIKVQKVKLELGGLGACEEEYVRYHRDLVASMDLVSARGFEGLTEKIIKDLTQEFSKLGVGLESDKRLDAELKKKKIIEKAIQDVSSCTSPDKLLTILLDLEDSLGIKKENSFTTPYMRQILFAKAMEHHSGFRELPQEMTGNEGVTLEGAQYIRDIIQNVLKDHVLGDEESKKYFSDEYRPSSKALSKLRKIFPSPKIVDVLKSIEGDLEEGFVKISVIPDRGFTGELSGYYSEACYTRIDNMLREWPNVVPAKFVIETDAEPGIESRKEIIGAVLFIESVDEDGEAVLIVRANNPRDEYLKKMQAESFCKEVYRVAKEYATKRGIGRVLVTGVPGTTSNRDKINTYVSGEVKGKEVVRLRDSLKFNDYEIKDGCVEV